MSDTDEYTIESLLVSNGFSPRTITPVSATREPVYRVVSNSGEYYVKVLAEKKGEAMSDVIDRNLDIGTPESRMIQGDEQMLVMAPAHGRPLSVYLPVCLLPGAWWASVNLLSKSMFEIGNKIGNLHAGTSMGERGPANSECRMANRLELGSILYEYFDDGMISDIERLFDEVRTTELPFTRIHGDPTPHNVFREIRSGETAIIDYNLHKSVALEDLVVFESGIELMAARLPYGRSSQKNVLIESFRSGYRETGVHSSIGGRNLDILKLSYYSHLLEKYLRHAAPDTTREKLTRHTDRVIVQRKIRSLLSDL
jgi:Ser/Thr protein kinase RdoA (MazF antagonist)